MTLHQKSKKVYLGMQTWINMGVVSELLWNQ